MHHIYAVNFLIVKYSEYDQSRYATLIDYRKVFYSVEIQAVTEEEEK